jgi:hypothetical protein
MLGSIPKSSRLVTKLVGSLGLVNRLVKLRY